MVKRILRILLVVAILTLNVVPIFAGDSVVITVTGVPEFTDGITSFTITYVTDTNMKLDWTYDPSSTQNVMIRSKYGAYPADIPDSTTAPSDGNLVYYGTATTFSDTAMNFDENPGLLYYKAWAQKPDGTWFTFTSSGFKESERLTFIGLIVLAAILTYFAVTKVYPLAVASTGMWIGLAFYISANPLPNIAAGSSVDTIIHVVLWGVGLISGIYCAGKLFSNSDGRTLFQKATGTGNDATRVYNYNGDNKRYKPNAKSSNSDERQMAYRQELRERLNKHRK